MKKFDLLTISQIDAIVEAPTSRELLSAQFDRAGILKWVRSCDAPIRQIFTYVQWKGGVVTPRWGISLDFVPHLSGSTLKWHRTPKSAVLDLVVDARDKSLEMTYSEGEQTIRNQAQKVIPKSVERANDFWRRCKSVSDLPRAFDWVRSHYSTGGLDFYSYVQHPLALSFVYAMNNRMTEAESELAHYVAYQHPDESVSQRLRVLLANMGSV